MNEITVPSIPEAPKDPQTLRVRLEIDANFLIRVLMFAEETLKEKLWNKPTNSADDSICDEIAAVKELRQAWVDSEIIRYEVTP